MTGLSDVGLQNKRLSKPHINAVLSVNSDWYKKIESPCFNRLLSHQIDSTPPQNVTDTMS